MRFLRFSLLLCLGCFVALVGVTAVSYAAVDIPFTVTMSEAVNVTGSPRIAVDVGGVTRYASYTSGSGSSALTFTYSVVSGDVDADGVVLSSPIQLNGGTIMDLAGNAANLAFTVPNTAGVIVNGAVPSGYSVAFSDDTVTNVNKTALSFIITSPKVNRTYQYSITSSGGGAPITGSGTLTVSPQTVSGINVTGLPDGILTVSVTLTDSLGGVGVAATDTIPMAVLTANLVGHWTFDTNDVSGTTAFDRSGSGLNGTIQGGAVTAAGYIGRGIVFHGYNSGDKVSLGTSTTLNPTNFTLSTWLSPGAINGAYAYLYSNARDCCGTYKGIEFRINANRLVGVIWNSTNFARTSTASIANNSGWHHLAYTYDGATLKLYIDGAFDSQGASALGVGGPASFGSYIGTMGLSAGQYTLDGTMDDVRLYNSVLNASQISTIYAAH